MGLELYAVRDLKPVIPLGKWLEAHPDDYPEDEGKFVMPYASWMGQEEVFPGRADGIEPDMVYEFDTNEAEGFCMGGYGTYNGFRRTVERFAEERAIRARMQFL